MFGKFSVPRRGAARSFRPALECLEVRDVPATLLTGYSENTVASGLVRPSAMEIAPDGRFLIAQQDGDLRVVSNNQLQPTPALHLTVDSSGERGLIGVTVDPNYLSNHYIYLYYTVPGEVAHNRVSRFTLNGDTVVSGSEQILMELPALGATNHNGGALHFGTDGKLYIAVGDNANPRIDPMAVDTRFGKLLRINADGSIPTDNPFYNTTVSGNAEDPGDKRSIWAVGLRNPYTFAVQPGFGQVFINDVGQSTWEEINVGKAGANYGWRATEGPTTAAGITSPTYAYTHGGGAYQGAAIVGGSFYNPAVTRFPREYGGTYFFADLVGGWIHNLNPRTRAVTRFALGITYPVDVRVSSSGYLYYLARGTGDTTGSVVGISFNATDLSNRGASLTPPARTTTASSFKVSRSYTITGSPFVSSFQIRYVASTDAVLGNGDDFVVGLETVPGAASSKAGARTGTSPALRIARTGSFYLFAVLDSGLAIPETNETNNVLRSTGKITVT